MADPVMAGHERIGLIERIRQVRRATATADALRAATPGREQQVDLDALEARVAHLEQLVQGLQDSVHRESSRHEKLIAELDARTQPAALVKALSDDARARGL